VIPARTCGAPHLPHLGTLDSSSGSDEDADDDDDDDDTDERGHRTHEKGRFVSSRTLGLAGNRAVTGWMGLLPTPTPPPPCPGRLAAGKDDDDILVGRACSFAPQQGQHTHTQAGRIRLFLFRFLCPLPLARWSGGSSHHRFLPDTFRWIVSKKCRQRSGQNWHGILQR
jgi:hypothetical protein